MLQNGKGTLYHSVCVCITKLLLQQVSHWV